MCKEYNSDLMIIYTQVQQTTLDVVTIFIIINLRYQNVISSTRYVGLDICNRLYEFSPASLIFTK
jgi:hypothetical protein